MKRYDEERFTREIRRRVRRQNKYRAQALVKEGQQSSWQEKGIHAIQQVLSMTQENHELNLSAQLRQSKKPKLWDMVRKSMGWITGARVFRGSGS